MSRLKFPEPRPPAVAADAATELGERSLLVWPGPERHVFLLDRDGERMSLETARLATDFAAASGRGPLRLELAAEDPDAVWPVLWYLVQYAERKAEWVRRPAALAFRGVKLPKGPRARFLGEHRVAWKTICPVSGVPGKGEPPGAAQGLCVVAADAQEPARWTDQWVAAGWSEVLVRPEDPGPGPQARRHFVSFYSAVLDRLLHHAREGAPIRELWAAAALGRMRWKIPGLDVLHELAYDPSGAVFSSEAAAVSDTGEGVLRLATLPGNMWQDLAKSPVLRTILAAAWGENQPWCVQCRYKDSCALPASGNLRTQGTLWGRMPSSALCALQMDLLDALFERLADPENGPILKNWAV